MWCRPEPSSVSPMYMPGRLRTASRPFEHLDGVGAVFAGQAVEASSSDHSISSTMVRSGGVHLDAHGPPFERSSNSARSVPVRKACRPSAAISSNRAARRWRSRCAATSSSNNIGFGPQMSRAESRAAWARTEVQNQTLSARRSSIPPPDGSFPQADTSRSVRWGPVKRPARRGVARAPAGQGEQQPGSPSRPRAPVVRQAQRRLREGPRLRGRSISACRASTARSRAGGEGGAGPGRPGPPGRRARRGRSGRRSRAGRGALADGLLVGRDRRRHAGRARRRRSAGRGTAAAPSRPPGTAGPAGASASTSRITSARRPGGAGSPLDAHQPRGLSAGLHPVPTRTSPPRLRRQARAAPTAAPRSRRARAARPRPPPRSLSPLARRQEGDRLQEVGLAGPVGPNR